jgi:hypothetical protein
VLSELIARLPEWDLVSGLHQGQRPLVPRKQAEQMTASVRSESNQLNSCIPGAIHR